MLILGKASADFYPPFSFTTKTGIIRIWGPVEWVGAEFNGYFLVMLEALGHHSIPKIYIHPMSKVVLLPLKRALQVFGGQLNGLQWVECVEAARIRQKLPTNYPVSRISLDLKTEMGCTWRNLAVPYIRTLAETTAWCIWDVVSVCYSTTVLHPSEMMFLYSVIWGQQVSIESIMVVFANIWQRIGADFRRQACAKLQSFCTYFNIIHLLLLHSHHHQHWDVT